MESITKGQAFGDAFPLHKKNIFFSFYLTKAEAIGLRWEDIDFAKRIISINHSVTYYPRRNDTTKCEFGVSLPKTEAGIRTIPMMDAVYEAFQEEYSEQKEEGFNTTVVDGMTGFIFSNRFGNLHNPQAVNRAIKRIYESYNAEEVLNAKKEKRQPVIIPHFSCHHLRHTFTTRLVEAGVNLKVIQDTLGHKDFSTTMDVYTDVTNELKQREFGNFQEKIDQQKRRKDGKSNG